MWMLLTWFRCVTAVWLAFWTWLLRKITFEGRWRISWTNWLTWEWLDSEWMPVSTCGLAIWTTFTAVSTTWIPNGSPAAADPLSSRRWGLVFCFFLCRTIFLLDVNPFFFFFLLLKRWLISEVSPLQPASMLVLEEWLSLNTVPDWENSSGSGMDRSCLTLSECATAVKTKCQSLT